MIQSFREGNTAELFTARKNARWAAIRTVALRKLDQLEASVSLLDLSIPPGNRLEPLKGHRRGQHSIRINDQYRICFLWKPDGAYEVEITDYH